MSNKLVAYFSASGVTAKVAETLAEAIGADVFEIEPKVPYTEADLNWMEKNARSTIEMNDPASRPEIVPFPVSWTVKMKKKQKETQDILSYHTQAAGCSDKARAKASGGRQPIEECGRTGL